MIDRPDTLGIVRAVMGKVFGVPPDSLTEHTRAGDVARWDSLSMVIVAIGLERRLGRDVPVELCLRAQSVGALLDGLCALPARSGGGA